jgi:alkanesulfonate monooxygenase SsuD/methylene tetrahydromethanopterin reductase-like flavin-dependent oxidoreductase (luciferase family)
MKIGIGLPATIPGVEPGLILEWAQQADHGPFSSLGVIDRMVYPNYESLVTLAAAAAVTQRIRLMTTVLIAPLRPAGLLAKQSASLDALSRGRLTLGLAVGIREDDYLAAPAAFHTRGKHFEEQLTLMTRIWSGQPIDEHVGPIGPSPLQAGGPEVLLGGFFPAAIQRVGRWGNGFIAASAGVQSARSAYSLAEQAWQEAGRTGKPKLVAVVYYCLGQEAAEHAAAYLGHYYAFMGAMVQQLVNATPCSAEAVRSTMQAFADIGTDELIFLPCRADLDQLHRLADLVSI